jgi:hypothetical protein
MDTITANILNVVKQKSDQTYTVVVELPEEAEHLPSDTWTIESDTNLAGITRIDRLWHVYFEGDPGLKAGDTLLILVQRGAKGEVHH